jgi:hypothetical protein
MCPSYVCCCGLQFLILFLRGVDQLRNMMDDIAEQQDVAKVVSEAISNLVASGKDVSEVSSETLKKISLFEEFLFFFFC